MITTPTRAHTLRYIAALSTALRGVEFEMKGASPYLRVRLEQQQSMLRRQLTRAQRSVQ